MKKTKSDRIFDYIGIALIFGAILVISYFLRNVAVPPDCLVYPDAPACVSKR